MDALPFGRAQAIEGCDLNRTAVGGRSETINPREDRMKPRYKPRISLKSPAVFAANGVIGQGRVLNLTNPGCLIESSVAVKQGDYLNLKLLLEGLKSPLLVTGGQCVGRMGHSSALSSLK